ncbi:pyridoxal 5'-phosphate synthase [Mesobacillus sp. AQ2]|uniref:pyridoxine/pyridoxamine 5'-phosphate oxidase n=1 Tax=Mesobacillus sp. AQ2 TaxID=3043332 RepID=UPI0024C14E22|nr:pyridoxal 5'-phosphate synthase [Mesobacillus sp. AQ2]WHX41294.1 pyridoxal 5'-phosphate synthase [Mesobacillus sp. AQ2]
MEDIRKVIRQSKTLVGPFPPFNVEDTAEHPYDLFLEWFQVAIDNGVNEPHSMTLSTTDANGCPDARVLIIKDVDQHGWYFASSSESEKGKQIENNPHVAMTFYWSEIGRQVRIRGKAVKMDQEVCTQDFLKRGTVARAIALLGKQSTVMNRQQEADEAVRNQMAILQQQPNLVYPSWTLYRTVAEEVEFWQAQEDRNHIRLKYFSEKDHWLKRLLWA